MGLYLSVVEYGVQSYPHPEMAHDERGWGGWHFCRIEYWDSEQPYAFLEHNLWLPPSVNSAVFEDWLNEKLEESK